MSDGRYERFIVFVELVNSHDAVAKMMLTVKQGKLGIESVNIHRREDGDTLSVVMLLNGQENKAEWLVNKLLNFPYYRSAKVLKHV
ncbi:MAG: hypothetical protein RMK31_08285 [Candidatus Caldarchaeum sp.]|nr:hypothetical protein [Candidatus Caldarchaeum sp.]MDW7978653.1 hypothetical protein [Candidatus Caldarchaeum sp.]MDW8360560.1 hypothetical protein [Candidatus Caldarchaeum sp.]